MTHDFVGWTPPPGAVVDPPVHPETVVHTIYSDGATYHDHSAGRINWSADGDGPRIVAYAVAREYKPEPVLREWWIVDDCEAWGSLTMAQNALRQLRFRGDEPIIHVREVPDPSREVVAWAVIDGGEVQTATECEGYAMDYQRKRGGTVVRLSGVRP